jgi:hypothetical protein
VPTPVLKQECPYPIRHFRGAAVYYCPRDKISTNNPELSHLRQRAVLGMPVRDGVAPAGARLLRRAPGTHAGLAKGPTTVYEPDGGGWKRWSTGRRPRVNYRGRRRYSVMARPFRWTYTLLEGERW